MVLKTFFIILVFTTISMTKTTYIIPNKSVLNVIESWFSQSNKNSLLPDNKIRNKHIVDPYPAPSVEPTQIPYPGPFSTVTLYPTSHPKVWLTPTFAPTETKIPK
jgi:hypothetical protein